MSGRIIETVRTAVRWQDDPEDPDPRAGRGVDGDLGSGDVDPEDLDAVLEALESVDWNRCPSVAVETVAMFHGIVADAREDLE